MTETRPSGDSHFEWNSETHEFDQTSGLSVGYNWKHFNTEGNTFAFKGVYPALPALGEHQYLVTGSSTLQGSTIVHELDGDSQNYVLACFANNNINATEYSTGALDVDAKTTAWCSKWYRTTPFSCLRMRIRK